MNAIKKISSDIFFKSLTQQQTLRMAMNYMESIYKLIMIYMLIFITVDIALVYLDASVLIQYSIINDIILLILVVIVTSAIVAVSYYIYIISIAHIAINDVLYMLRDKTVDCNKSKQQTFLVLHYLFADMIISMSKFISSCVTIPIINGIIYTLFVELNNNFNAEIIHNRLTILCIISIIFSLIIIGIIINILHIHKEYAVTINEIIKIVDSPFIIECDNDMNDCVEDNITRTAPYICIILLRFLIIILNYIKRVAHYRFVKLKTE